jgi:triacylglycerol esterase/lipase EstA (alpha/beta hydrolase family)
MEFNWGSLSPIIANHGYCVFALTYGRNMSAPYPFNEFGGTIPMEQSAVQLGAFIDRVLHATGAAKVDLVGHSEGSLMPDYYVKFLGGAAKVARYVGITPLWDGTNIAWTATLHNLGRPSGIPQQIDAIEAPFCGPCPETLQGSDFLNKLNAGGAAVAGVTYTMLMTRNDELVWPYTSGYLRGATNIVVQDQCPLDPAEHIAMAADPIVARDVLNALDPPHAVHVDCNTELQSP